jgi:excisionase family DNA binding protein
MNAHSVCPLGTWVYFTESGERLLRTSTVAEMIGRTPRMVRYLAAQGRIPAFKKGKLWFFKRCDIEHYLHTPERYHA